MKGTRNYELSSILGKGILVMLMAALFMLPSWIVTKVVYGSDIPKEFQDMVESFDGNNKLSVYNPIHSSTTVGIVAMDPNSPEDPLGLALDESWNKVSTVKVRPGIYRVIRFIVGIPYYVNSYWDYIVEEGYDYYVVLDTDPYSDASSWKIKRVKR